MQGLSLGNYAWSLVRQKHLTIPALIVLLLAGFSLTFSKTYADNQAAADAVVALIRENQRFETYPPEEITLPDPPPPPAPTPDPRLSILTNYLSQFNSPLKDHARDFLDAADSYGVDWKLLPSIAGVESTFGKKIPGGLQPKYSSYNGWGWGVYGTQVIKFQSWRDAIFAVTKGLKQGYIDQGLTDPFAMNQKYASSPYWGSHVAYFLNDLAQFAKENIQPSELSKPEQLQAQIFQNYTYLEVQEDHFSLKTTQ